MITSHMSSFAGLPVLPYTPGMALPKDPSSVAWRLAVEEFDADPQEFADLLQAMLDDVPGETVRAVVIGEWGESYERPLPIDLLVAAASRWTGLRALFLAELVSEECEISWLTLDDITPLLAAYPMLGVLRVRGARGLRLDPVRHTELRELRFESGGLPAAVVRAVGASDLPALRRLDLWLGQASYGADTTVDDLAPVLAGTNLPALRHLALANAEIADAIAAAVAQAPVVGRLDVLDLSKGSLTDTGAEALLGGQSLSHLRELDLHYHYLSPQWQQRLVEALPAARVDVSDPQTPYEYNGRQYYYTAVGE